MAAAVATLLDVTLSLLDAVAEEDESRMQVFASHLRRLGWMHALPGLASAAGALVMSLDEGATFDGEVALAVQAVAYEMQTVVREH
jgi:hypothetical protein